MDQIRETGKEEPARHQRGRQCAVAPAHSRDFVRRTASGGVDSSLEFLVNKAQILLTAIPPRGRWPADQIGHNVP